MSLGMILSSTALGISFVVSAVKFLDWLLHSEPRTIIRTGQWLLLVLAAISVPCLFVLLALQQWTMAMALGAGMVAVPALLGWRTLIPHMTFLPGRTVINSRNRLHGDFDQPPPDTELVRRAVSVLEEYIRRADQREFGAREGPQSHTKPQPAEFESGGSMEPEEALAVLGLEADASATAVRAAHRRLMQLLHPDRGGSNYLSAKINRAKEVLLAETRGKPHAPTRCDPRPAAKRAANKGT